jgi:hypothetical protein
MSPREFRGWLRSDLLAPPMHNSQPTSSGSTQPVSLSSSDSALLHRRISTEGQYASITWLTTPTVTQDPKVVPADGPPPVSHRCSPRPIIGGLMPLTPIITQTPITGQEPSKHTHSRQSSGGYSYQSLPAVGTADIPEGLLSTEDS